MIVLVRLEMSDESLRTIRRDLTDGEEKGKATRAEVVEWVTAQVDNGLEAAEARQDG